MITREELDRITGHAMTDDEIDAWLLMRDAQDTEMRDAQDTEMRGGRRTRALDTTRADAPTERKHQSEEMQ